MAAFRIFVVSGVLLSLAAAQASADSAPDFNRDIRPILSDRCFACHGPDEAARKAELRLDDIAWAIDEGYIEPGDPDRSEIFERILSEDPGERMPPPSFHVGLSTDEAEKIRAWIAAGAPYAPHWSFVPVSMPDVPEVAGAESPLDAFVRARLQAEGLAPAPEADRATLLRRVTFDLTGLPPTPEELDAFLADTAPDAYTRVVERLLASPAYGERMAMDWLDAARYADTFGYQSDVENEVWPWRDWVIRAFNENLPYDQFLTWQLAGDLLPTPTQEQRIATAFNRLHRQTNEGGSVEEEFRVEYVADRTETVGTAILGLTMQCARCHDHKYDPVSQRDYFSLFAFFDDIDESGVYSHFTRTAPTPNMPLYGEGEEARHASLKARIAEREAQLAEKVAEAGNRVAAWLAAGAAHDTVAPVAHWPLDAVAEGKTADLARPDKPAALTLAPVPVTGAVEGALRFSGEDAVSSGEVPLFDRFDEFSLALWVRAEQVPDYAVILHRSKAANDAASRGYEILLQEQRPTFSLVHFWPGDAIRVRAQAPLPAGEWVHLAVTYDGSSRAAGVRVFVNGVAQPLDVIRDGLTRTITYEGGEPPLTLAQRFRDVGFKNGALDDFRLYDVQLSGLEVAALAKNATPDFTTAEAEGLREYFALRVDDEARQVRSRLHTARRLEAKLIQRVPHLMVMEELPEPRTAYVLKRGQYDQRGEAVSPATPAALLPFPADAPRNRLGLAQWLTDRQHPLTARVAVNRYWQLFFGRGLVTTPEDFGNQSAPPSHPELLDYLAATFMDSGWDVKALVRMLVMSATYRQDSEATPALRERDPFNTLLARGPRHRLSAEAIRDRALAASGLLVPAIGGPSVKPYHPAGLWEASGSSTYEQDHGDGLYRRTMYSFLKRTVPPPSLTTFDATNREVCTVRRERTQTPLQSLVLLNDPQYVEAARVLAARVWPGHADTPEALRALFRALLVREPQPQELAVLGAAYEEQRALFAQAPESARAYLATGEQPAPETEHPEQLAAATAVAQLLMNFDEFQVKQ